MSRPTLLAHEAQACRLILRPNVPIPHPNVPKSTYRIDSAHQILQSGRPFDIRAPPRATRKG
jgi:hypothetical protein